MKELYLGMAIIALVLIALSITIETSFSENIKLRKNLISNKTESVKTSYSLSDKNDWKNNKPDKVWTKNNLNNSFLRKYYNNNYYNNQSVSNKFYVPN